MMKYFFVVVLVILEFLSVNGQEYSYSRYEVSNPKSQKVVSINIHDNLLKKNIVFPIKVNSLDFNDFRQAQYIDNTLYILLYHNTITRGEVWKFTNKDSKLIIAANFMLSFKVSPDNKLLAFTDKIVRIISIDGKNETNLTNVSTIESMLFIYGWSSDSKLIWFYRDWPTCFIDSIFSYNMITHIILCYPNPKDYCEFSINTDKSLILYSDFPTGCSADKDEIDLSKSLFYLYLLDFKTNEQKLIRQNVGKAFSPAWIGKDTCEYFDVESNKRIQIKCE